MTCPILVLRKYSGVKYRVFMVLVLISVHIEREYLYRVQASTSTDRKVPIYNSIDLHMDPPEPDYHISMNSDADNITWR